MRTIATALIWICSSSHSNCTIHVLGEVSYLEIGTMCDPSALVQVNIYITWLSFIKSTIFCMCMRTGVCMCL